MDNGVAQAANVVPSSVRCNIAFPLTILDVWQTKAPFEARFLITMQSSHSSATTSAPNPIKEGLKDIRGLYTDCTLVCNGREFPTHRLILHLYSRTFATAFKEVWQEGQSIEPKDKSLKVPDDMEPETIQAMLDWFYTFNYEPPEDASKLEFHLKVYTLADFYDAAGLTKGSLRHFEIECEGDKWAVQDLVLAVRFLESRSGAVGYNRIRSIIVATIKANLARLLGSGEFTDLLSEFKELNVELLRLTVQQSAASGSQNNQSPTGQWDGNGHIAAIQPQVAARGAQRGRGGGGTVRGGRGRGGGGGG